MGIKNAQKIMNHADVHACMNQINGQTKKYSIFLWELESH